MTSTRRKPADYPTVGNRGRQGLTVSGPCITAGEYRIVTVFKMNLCKENGDSQIYVNLWDLLKNLQHFFLWECENPHFKVWHAWNHCIWITIHTANTHHVIGCTVWLLHFVSLCTAQGNKVRLNIPGHFKLSSQRGSKLCGQVRKWHDQCR